VLLRQVGAAHSVDSPPQPNPGLPGFGHLRFAGSGQARSRLGRGWGWGSEFEDTARATTTTPLPIPPPTQVGLARLAQDQDATRASPGRGGGGSRPSLRSAPSVAVPPERGACRRYRRRVRDGSEGGHRNQHGQGESSDERLHGGSPYLDHRPCFASALKTNRPAPARGNMAAPAAAACDGDHRFRTIQNDSDSSAGVGALVSAHKLPSGQRQVRWMHGSAANAVRSLAPRSAAERGEGGPSVARAG
jgi:hypothetical protein